jgi:hypothetical protein
MNNRALNRNEWGVRVETQIVRAGAQHRVEATKAQIQKWDPALVGKSVFNEQRLVEARERLQRDQLYLSVLQSHGAPHIILSVEDCVYFGLHVLES